jgi:AraC-like DNA-binding protein
MQSSLYLSVVFVRGLVAELARRGLDPEELLEGSSLEPGLLSDSRAVVSAEEWHALVGRAARLTADTSLGLSLSEHLPDNTVQLVSQLALSCGTLREAMKMLARYTPLLGNVLSFELVEEGEIAYFTYDAHVQEPTLPQFGAEVALGLVYRFARRFPVAAAGDAQEVWFKHAAPEYAARYSRVFSCPVRFSRPRNCIVIERRLLDVPQHCSDALMLELLQAGAERMMRELGNPSLPDRVRALLRYEQDLCHVDARRIARALRLHPRALRRQLAAANTPFSMLLDEVRRRIACEELAVPGASIKAISDRLGFSEPSAFHRAFKRWTGQTPSEYGRSGGPGLMLGSHTLLDSVADA